MLSNIFDRVLRFILNPQQIFFKTWKQFPVGSFKLRLDYDIFPRPHYAFCAYQAAKLANRLGMPSISLIEFGVAGGDGLLELERLAESIEEIIDIEIQIYGFDTGAGLPEPVDYRDLPYVWQEGFFRMDVAALESRLSRAKLVIGDVAESVPTFFEKHSPAPIGAVFHDLDYYSSTLQALQVLEADDSCILPRVYCYCDDILGSDDGGLLCDQVGQPLAIREYNERSGERCLEPLAGIGRRRNRPAMWNDQIFIHHTFTHAEYNTYVYSTSDRQLKLG